VLSHEGSLRLFSPEGPRWTAPLPSRRLEGRVVTRRTPTGADGAWITWTAVLLILVIYALAMWWMVIR